MAEFCDLHMHSSASDGTDLPGDLPRLCRDAGLGAFALTDHDTTAGLAACGAAAGRLKIDFVPGIELSVDPDLDRAREGRSSGVPGQGTMHLLGYFVDPEHPPLVEIVERLRVARAERNPRIVEKLSEQGIRIDYGEVVAVAQGGGRNAGAERGVAEVEPVIGRPHIAQVLLQKGYVKSIHEAFVKYLGVGGGAHVRRDRLAAAEAIEVIHTAGGVVSLAHPVQLRAADNAALEHTVSRLKLLGLDGIETGHSDHTPADVRRFTGLAQAMGLVATGGSDYHGSRKPIGLNSERVPIEVMYRLRDARG
ncbi:MAG: PHP domain-containing protein [Planctomycetota bacterium]